MSDTQQNDWTKPAAMAIPKGGFLKDKVQQGSPPNKVARRAA